MEEPLMMIRGKTYKCHSYGLIPELVFVVKNGALFKCLLYLQCAYFIILDFLLCQKGQLKMLVGDNHVTKSSENRPKIRL